MKDRERQEFIIMLLLENRSSFPDTFYEYLEEKYDLEKFNKRYLKLLDKFMKPYALNNAEKSE